MVFEPRPYQSYCIKRIMRQTHLALFLDMGLGKTVITLTAIQRLIYDAFAVHKVLVIAPLKVAETTWSDECAKWDHLKDLRISKILGTPKQRNAALAENADVYITNRENVVWLVETLGKRWDFDMVVCDEFSSFKSRQAKRFKALRSVRGKIQRLVGLTGTPASRSLEDLWAQIYLLDGGERLGRTLTSYRQTYFDPDKRNRNIIYSYGPKAGARDAIIERLSDICVTLRASDLIELPDMVVCDRRFELPPDAVKAYRKLKKELLLEYESGDITAPNAAALTGKLLQFANGAVYDENGGVKRIHTAKMEALAEMLEELRQEKSHALLFYSYKHDLEGLTEVCEKLCPGRFARLNTDEDLRRWNAGELDILIAHPASTAYGLNLQHGGNHVIWFGLPWSLELYEQANKRLHRSGQRQTVFVHRLIAAHTADEQCAAALENKADVQNALLDALKADI